MLIDATCGNDIDSNNNDTAKCTYNSSNLQTDRLLNNK